MTGRSLNQEKKTESGWNNILSLSVLGIKGVSLPFLLGALIIIKYFLAIQCVPELDWETIGTFLGIATFYGIIFLVYLFLGLFFPAIVLNPTDLPKVVLIIYKKIKKLISRSKSADKKERIKKKDREKGINKASALIILMFLVFISTLIIIKLQTTTQDILETIFISPVVCGVFATWLINYIDGISSGLKTFSKQEFIIFFLAFLRYSASFYGIVFILLQFYLLGLIGKIEIFATNTLSILAIAFLCAMANAIFIFMPDFNSKVFGLGIVISVAVVTLIVSIIPSVVCFRTTGAGDIPFYYLIVDNNTAEAAQSLSLPVIKLNDQRSLIYDIYLESSLGSQFLISSRHPDSPLSFRQSNDLLFKIDKKDVFQSGIYNPISYYSFKNGDLIAKKLEK